MRLAAAEAHRSRLHLTHERERRQHRLGIERFKADYEVRDDGKRRERGRGFKRRRASKQRAPGAAAADGSRDLDLSVCPSLCLWIAMTDALGPKDGGVQPATLIHRGKGRGGYWRRR